MRAAPAFEVRVQRFGVWRVAVLTLALTAVAAVAAWWFAQPLPRPVGASAGAGAAAAVSLALALGLARQRSLRLRWDRQSWHLTCGGSAESSGALAVAIDLGAWMLLRFVPERTAGTPPWRRRAAWIALQRRGLEPQWHALRCTLYAAHPAEPAGAGADDA